LVSEGAAKVTIALDILHELLAEQLSKDELEEFAKELMRYANCSATPILLGD
jgi:hypothetical protein